MVFVVALLGFPVTFPDESDKNQPNNAPQKQTKSKVLKAQVEGPLRLT